MCTWQDRGRGPAAPSLQGRVGGREGRWARQTWGPEHPNRLVGAAVDRPQGPSTFPGRSPGQRPGPSACCRLHPRCGGRGDMKALVGKGQRGEQDQGNTSSRTYLNRVALPTHSGRPKDEAVAYLSTSEWFPSVPRFSALCGLREKLKTTWAPKSTPSGLPARGDGLSDTLCAHETQNYKNHQVLSFTDPCIASGAQGHAMGPPTFTATLCSRNTALFLNEGSIKCL